MNFRGGLDDKASQGAARRADPDINAHGRAVLHAIRGAGTGGAYCDIATPMLPSQSQIATMSVAEKKQVLTQLRYGQRHCGWRQGQ